MTVPIDRWFLKYIRHYKEPPGFYSSYGSFMHKLIELYYRGELSKEEMSTRFLLGFQTEVEGERPQASTVEKYIRCGLEYLNSFKPFPYNMIDVEKKVKFEIDGIPFVGIIDYLGEKYGELYIVDNKSRDLKPRSHRAVPTAKDKELDSMLKQLYIYSEAVKYEFGAYPKALCFNCFKSGAFIEEPFDPEAHKQALEWAVKNIEDIKKTELFYPRVDYFSCTNLCGLRDECCYYQSTFRYYRGR